jgi:predicted small lipoprotein YifL
MAGLGALWLTRPSEPPGDPFYTGRPTGERTMRVVFLILVLTLSALGGCGQRGSLYLPDEPAQEPVPQDADGPAETDDERERRKDKDARSGED